MQKRGKRVHKWGNLCKKHNMLMWIKRFINEAWGFFLMLDIRTKFIWLPLLWLSWSGEIMTKMSNILILCWEVLSVFAHCCICLIALVASIFRLSYLLLFIWWLVSYAIKPTCFITLIDSFINVLYTHKLWLVDLVLQVNHHHILQVQIWKPQIQVRL